MASRNQDKNSIRENRNSKNSFKNVSTILRLSSEIVGVDNPISMDIITEELHGQRMQNVVSNNDMIEN